MKKLMLIFLLNISLVACGGGSSDSSTTNTTNNTPPPAAAPTTIADREANGIWEGNITEAGGQAHELFGLLYEGEIFGLSKEANRIYVGTYSVDDDDITGNVTVLEIGGSVIGTASLDGVVTHKSQISITHTPTYGSAGSIALFYENIYERSSSFAKLAGNYSSLDPGYSLALSIQNDGSLTGFDTNGCQVTGNVAILDDDFNLYKLTTPFSSCGNADGVYTGFATLSDLNGVDDILTVALSSENYVFIVDLLRQ